MSLPRTFKRLVNGILSPLGLRVVNARVVERDMFDDPVFAEIFELCRPYTMTGAERIYALCRCAAYIARNRIPGSLAELGVWRGGSAMAMAAALLRCEGPARDLYLYDLFGEASADGEVYWAAIPEREVRDHLALTAYPAEHLHFVAGDVRRTASRTPPGELSLLRLDVDEYEPTRAALASLYPRVVPGGVVIVDDYGTHPEGARKATDELLETLSPVPLLHRVDGSARLWIKSAAD